MAKISGSIPNFANGISQQAMALRLASQGDLQVNAYSTVVDGLRKRPPTKHVASLGSELGDNVHSHMINRDAFERYEVLMNKTGIRVFDLNTGDEKTVATPDGFSYLNYTGDGKPPYRALTIGDYTFVTNQTKVPALTSTVETPFPSEAIVHVLAGNYGKDYMIRIGGTIVARYRTPDGDSAAQAPAVDTRFIAERLAFGNTVALSTTVNGKANGNWTWKGTDTNLNAAGINSANGWTVKVFRGTIYIKRNSGAAFNIGVEDGYNGYAMKAIQRHVQDFADLPAYCENNMAVEVTGSVSTKFDNYYVRFGKYANEDTSSPGVWREVAGPGSKTTLNAALMPHVLVRETDGTFTFKQAYWALRKCGDEETIPPPSFVGQAINDISFYKNRLVFLAGENVVMSRAGEFFDFWRATATSLLDDDPIDVAAAENGVSVLRAAIGYANKLLLFADQQQFALDGEELLTPSTVSIKPVTSYAAASTSRPVSAGSSVFFPTKRGQFSMIREFKMDDNGNGEAEDVTGHVPQYIQGDTIRMAASTHEDILVVQADGAPNELWVYKYYWANDQKLQASWSIWQFPGVTKILDFGFINSTLMLVFQRNGATYLESIDVQPGGSDDNSNFIVHLDRRFRLDPVVGAEYDPYDDVTTIPMELNITEDVYIGVTAGDPNSTMLPGATVDIISRAIDQIVVRGDVTQVPIYFGIPYEMRYRMSTIFIRRETSSGGTQSVTEGRLQLLELLLQFSKTAYFKVEVTPLGHAMRTYVTTGRLMGDPNNMADTVVLNDGTFRFPLLSKNDRVKVEIVNDSYLPCSILSAEWIANYVSKSRRI